MDNPVDNSIVLLLYPNPVLTTKCPEYDYKGLVDDIQTAVKMGQLMMMHPTCYGLAAPQVGISKRFFVLRDGITGVRYCLDPKIVGHGRDIEQKWEKCMSIPGKMSLCPRWRVLSVEYVDETSTLRKVTLSGLDARAFQHEYDHLDGKLIIKTEADDA